MTEEKKTEEAAVVSPVKQKIKDFFLRFKPVGKNAGLARAEEQTNLDYQLVQAVNQTGGKRLPDWRQLQRLGNFLSKREKLILKIAGGILGLAVVTLILNFWFFILKSGPAYGGEYSEGLVGAPKYLNPVLAPANDVDLDISSLIFSGLMKRGPDGLTTDLAESYEISADQKEYSFTLRPEVKWQDGADREVTVDDVLLTFDLIKDPSVGSPLYLTFKGVNAERLDDRRLKFILKEPFAPFLSTLTFGVLPEHLWGSIDPANIKLAGSNLKPVGTGPFQFESLTKDSQGNIKSLTLAANKDYYAGRPYLAKAVFKFYPDFVSLNDALLNKNVLAASYLPSVDWQKIFGAATAAKGLTLHALDLPQYSAVFFNQSNNEALKDRQVRQALYQALDRQSIVAQVLAGQGKVVNSPILDGVVGYQPDLTAYDYAPTAATALLDKAKWQAITPNEYIEAQRAAEKKNLPEGEELVDRSDADRLAEITGQEYFRQKSGQILAVALTVVDQPESLAVGEIIKANWQAIGVKVDLNIISPDAVRREAIKPRNFQALLYSEIVGGDPDPYPFWHSSQSTEAGLNLASFKDSRVDRWLEVARQNSDPETRAANYKKFQEILVQEIPAIFLYQPKYPYAVSSSVQGMTMTKIFLPADRLSDLGGRYLKTSKSW
ncbi:MAG: peptide ABC transporter substrate-binding protein [Patescibacteria group bacterium]